MEIYLQHTKWFFDKKSIILAAYLVNWIFNIILKNCLYESKIVEEKMMI